MANRYWINTSGGNWSSSANWSTSSGGSGGASVPTSFDSVFFDQAGTYTVTFPSSTSSCLSFSHTAGTVNFSGGAACNLEVYGNTFVIQSTATWGLGGILRFVGTTVSVTTNGVTLDSGFTLTSGPSVTLQDNLTIATNNSYQIAHLSGLFNLNGKTVTAGKYVSSNTSVRTIAWGSGGSFVLKGTGTVWDTGTTTNLTISPSGTTSNRPVNFIPASTGTITINTGALAETQAPDCYFQSMPSGSTISFVSGSATNLLIFDSASANCTVSNAALTIYRSMQVSSNNFVFSAGTNAWTFASTGGPGAQNFGSQIFDFPWILSGSYLEINNITLGSTRSLTHNSGTLSLNGSTLTVGSYVTGAGTKTLTFNGGNLICAGSGVAFDNANPSGFTTSVGTGAGKIMLTALLAKTFNGGGSTFNCTLSNDGIGALTITGSNTFTTLANGIQPTTFTFTSGTTTTVTNWNISGTSGNLVTIGSTSTSQHTLSKSSGTVNATNLSISYSNATGGATWNAGTGSVNNGNNTGWLFAGGGGSFISFFTP